MGTSVLFGKLMPEGEECSGVTDGYAGLKRGTVDDPVIARTKATEAIQLSLTSQKAGLLREACHRAALCADPLARDDDFRGQARPPQYPSAQPSLRGSEPPVSVPLSQSIQIACPPPSGPTTLVVLCPSFLRPSTISAGTPSSSW